MAERIEWTPERRALLERTVKDVNLSWDDVVEILAPASRRAIDAACQRFGISMPYERRGCKGKPIRVWRDWEDDVLRKEYPAGSIPEIAGRLRRTPDAIKVRARSLGIRRRTQTETSKAIVELNQRRQAAALALRRQDPRTQARMARVHQLFMNILTKETVVMTEYVRPKEEQQQIPDRSAFLRPLVSCDLQTGRVEMNPVRAWRTGT